MNERTPVSAYKLLSSASIKQKLYVNFRRTPCSILGHQRFLVQRNRTEKGPTILNVFIMKLQNIIPASFSERPSRRLPETLQTASTYLLDTLQTTSRHLTATFQLPLQEP